MGWVGLVYNMLWVGFVLWWVGLGFKKLTHVHVWYMLRGIWQALNYFHSCNVLRDGHRGVPRANKK